MLRHRFVLAAWLAVIWLASSAGAEDSGRIDDAQFEKLHGLIKRQNGESRWVEIDWYPSVWEARKIAAAEGKPLFLMAGSGGAPAAGC